MKVPEGTWKVQERFRKGSGKVQGTSREGSGFLLSSSQELRSACYYYYYYHLDGVVGGRGLGDGGEEDGGHPDIDVGEEHYYNDI